MPFYSLAKQLVRADNDINFARFEIVKHLSGLCGSARTGKVINPYGKVFQSCLERLIMLIGQHRRRNQHGNLLGIAGRLEGSADSYLRLSEAYIAANQAVHGLGTLHIGLYVLGRL